MALYWETKRPAEVRTYQIDWTETLGADTIATHTIVAVGVTVDNGAGQGVIDAGNKSITLKLSGGTTGTLARITNTIVTAAGETEIETIVLYISDVVEPVSLAECKRQVRMVEDDSQDDFLCDLVAPARAYCEKRSGGHIFLRRRFTESFSRWGDYLSIWKRPLVVDVDNPLTVFYSASADPVDDIEYEGFVANTGVYPARISPALSGGGFPDVAAGGAIKVTYTAGYEEGSNDWAVLIGKRAMLLLIGHWFENRETVVIGQVSNEVDWAVRSLLDELSPISAH